MQLMNYSRTDSQYRRFLDSRCHFYLTRAQHSCSNRLQTVVAPLTIHRLLLMKNSSLTWSFTREYLVDHIEVSTRVLLDQLIWNAPEPILAGWWSFFERARSYDPRTSAVFTFLRTFPQLFIGGSLEPLEKANSVSEKVRKEFYFHFYLDFECRENLYL